ncbi:hypothetical protein TSOC_007470 [Tetrabaena socialis]|uniref:SAM domain-containing protein n=1 Tax=Tetrabaena socialis TaxID=47790 RepID=A0A2J8A0Z3_9CHLO|nr:hypothetical protein TSOC_007470 [Tetrabaena socialis]|eukprot:PNH06201.1 hypothetical protein TSOC_007470 [Tetrabaena socialis]
MATNWDLRAFLDRQKDLNEDEKKLCYQLLDEQGFSAADKENAFFNLNNADLKDAGVMQLSTRKVLLLAIEDAAAARLGSQRAAAPSLEEALFPSSLYCIAFKLYNGSRLATTLVSHAKALGFRGEVRHVSASRSDFTLLLSAAEGESSEQTLASFARWLARQVTVYKHAAEAGSPEAAGTSAAEVGGAYVVVTSDLSNPRTSVRAQLDLYRGGQLGVRATPGMQLELEQAAKAAEEEERHSRHSLGKASSSSAQE